MALSADPNTIVLAYALHEEPMGEEASVIVERLENGEVIGELLPENNHNAVFLFRGLSAKEQYSPDTDEQDTRRILNRFYAGGEMRVYRNFPADLDPFLYPKSYQDVNGDGNNTDGYSDIIAVDIKEVEYMWFDNVLQRFEFTIEGVAVR
jgi:hypothetical protein